MPDDTLHALGKEAASARVGIGIEEDDIEHILRGAREAATLRVRGRNYDLTRKDFAGADGLFLVQRALDARALLPVIGALDACARPRDAIRFGDHRWTRLGYLCPDEAAMIAFDRQNTRRRFQGVVARDQVASADIGGDTDILEQKGAEQEGRLVSEGIEACPEPGRLADGAKTVLKIERGTADLYEGRGADRAAKEADMRRLVGSDLLDHFAKINSLKWNASAAGHKAGIGTDMFFSETLARQATQIIFSLEIFEIERKVLN